MHHENFVFLDQRARRRLFRLIELLAFWLFSSSQQNALQAFV